MLVLFDTVTPIVLLSILYSICEVASIGFIQSSIFLTFESEEEVAPFFAVQKITSKIPRIFTGFSIVMFSFIKSTAVIISIIFIIGILGIKLVLNSRKS